MAKPDWIIEAGCCHSPNHVRAVVRQQVPTQFQGFVGKAVVHGRLVTSDRQKSIHV